MKRKEIPIWIDRETGEIIGIGVMSPDGKLLRVKCKPNKCPRCDGKLSDSEDGMSCFQCGNVVYSQPPDKYRANESCHRKPK